MLRSLTILTLMLAGPILGAAEAGAASLPGPRPSNTFVGDPVQHELEFQLDFSVWALATPERRSGLYVAFRQNALWDADNDAQPFRVEANFRPEVGLAIGSDGGQWLSRRWPDWLALTIAYVHESNGLEGEHSRGWNRMIGAVHVETAAARVRASVAGWYAFRVEDTNADLRRHAGDGELRLTTDLSIWLEDSSLRLRSPFSPDARNGRFFTSLEARLHLSPRTLTFGRMAATGEPPFDVVLEWFVGTAEFLYDYASSTNRVRVGIALRDGSVTRRP